MNVGRQVGDDDGTGVGAPAIYVGEWDGSDVGRTVGLDGTGVGL